MACPIDLDQYFMYFYFHFVCLYRCVGLGDRFETKKQNKFDVDQNITGCCCCCKLFIKRQ